MSIFSGVDGYEASCPWCGERVWVYYDGLVAERGRGRIGHKCQGKTYATYTSYDFDGIQSYNQIIEKPMECSSIKEKFLISLKSEPQKSFRKAGITNGDDMLTSEGRDIFLTWLLNKHGLEFKKDVVDGILENKDSKK